MNDILFIAAASFVSVVMFNKGMGWLGKLLTSLLGGMSREYYAMRKELWEKKRELASISAQDEFAKWARLKRRIESEEGKLQALERQSTRKGFLSGIVVQFFVYSVYAAYVAYLFWLAIFQMHWTLNPSIFLFPVRPWMLLILSHLSAIRLLNAY
jgi:hypothetical protein